MKKEAFDLNLNELFDEIKTILADKSEGYANRKTTDDRLYNFKAQAEFLHSKPQRELLSLYMKHFIVIRDWIVSGQEYTYNEFEERVIDCINYLILFYMQEKEKYEFEREEDT
jgi:hypothetical protein